MRKECINFAKKLDKMNHNTPEYLSLLKKWLAIQPQAPKVIEAFLAPLEPKLQSLNIQYRIETRLKDLSSIWYKMKRKNLVFEKVHDLIGIRLIINSTKEVESCYQAHTTFLTSHKSKHQDCKDYIKDKKPNGYASLHSTFIQNSIPIELQIRSEQMNEIATIGTASHKIYKLKNSWLS
jgi:guanosine-3',5'-bis(diphosphate) 3'-pyrophosphohydrolase